MTHRTQPRVLPSELHHLCSEGLVLLAVLIFETQLLNPLKLKLVYIIFKNSVHTAKKTQDFTVT
jgi:hypothetical protein